MKKVIGEVLKIVGVIAIVGVLISGFHLKKTDDITIYSDGRVTADVIEVRNGKTYIREDANFFGEPKRLDIWFEW